jgi:integrase
MTRGQDTADDYRPKLGWLLRFADQCDIAKRWPYAADIDRDFCLRFKGFLHTAQTTRNGRPGAVPTPISERHIYNVLEACRSLLRWGKRPEIAKLPSDWVIPLSDDIIGQRPSKPAFREQLLPVAARIAILAHMDWWQLCHLGILLVLPCRAGEVQGLLISDVDQEKRWLKFETRFGGADYTKGKTSFVLPYPKELEPLFRACQAGREEGPLFSPRDEAFERAGPDLKGKIEQLFSLHLQTKSASQIVTAQDRKTAFRRFLIKRGGISIDELRREMNRVLESAGLRTGHSLRTFREAVSEDMKRSGMNLLDLRYLTGHSTNDIMHTYTSVAPDEAMTRYFDHIRPLLNAIDARTKLLELDGGGSHPSGAMR